MPGRSVVFSPAGGVMSLYHGSGFRRESWELVGQALPLAEGWQAGMPTLQRWRAAVPRGGTSSVSSQD